MTAPLTAPPTCPANLTLPEGLKLFCDQTLNALMLEGELLAELRHQQNAQQLHWLVLEPSPEQPLGPYRMSPFGLRALMAYEGSSPDPYQDVAGYWTIGIGHLLDRTANKPLEQVDWTDYDRLGLPRAGLSEAQMLHLLELDLLQHVAALNAALQGPLTQELFDSVLSLSFNVGSANIRSSELLKLLNSGQYQQIPGEFYSWHKARIAGRLEPIPGLQNRRLRELVNFAVPCLRV